MLVACAKTVNPLQGIPKGVSPFGGGLGGNPQKNTLGWVGTRTLLIPLVRGGAVRRRADGSALCYHTHARPFSGLEMSAAQGDGMLTQQQQKQWDTFGFVTFKDLFTEDEVGTIRREFEAGLAAEQPYYSDGELPWHFTGLGPETPFLGSLPEDPRFLEAAEQMWGDDVVCMGSSGQRFTTNNTYWHPDLIQGNSETKDNHIRGVKFGFYLDPLDADDGALRLIPGSHRSPLHDELFAMGLKGDDSAYLRDAGLAVVDVPAYVWASGPADVVAFNNRTWHASWGGSADRRQVTIVYYKNAGDAREEELSYESARLSKTLRSNDDRRGPLYPPTWLANPNNNPTRQHWIDWLGKYGYLE